MAHFAELDENNTVLRVIVVDNDKLLDANGYENEAIGKLFCTALLGGNWAQTSYNKSFRKHYAGIRYTYDAQLDAFIPPKPYNSWILNEDTCLWEAPTAPPDDEYDYVWNESSESWQREA
jgi:hypothetical protein